jgi:hypothetical protein
MTGELKKDKSMKHLLALGLLAAVLSSACGDDSTTTTAPTPVRGSPVNESFEANLTPQGSVWRLFNAIQTGTVTATLSTTDQPSIVVGMGIGLRDATTTTCLLNKEVITTAGSAPQLSTTVDAGNYCVKLWDTGTLATPMAFTITLTYP